MPPREKRNGVVIRVFAGVAAVTLLGILGMSFSNQVAAARHSSTTGPHGQIDRDIATLNTNVEWLRKHLDIPKQPEEPNR